MTPLPERERLLRHGGHGVGRADGGGRGERVQQTVSVYTGGQRQLVERTGGSVGGEVLLQQTLDHLHRDGRQAALSHRGDPLGQILRLVWADRVYGGEDEAAVWPQVAGDDGAVMSCGWLYRQRSPCCVSRVCRLTEA